MKIVGIIPARYNSSRFPGKPLSDLNGKPMIMHVYQRARQASSLSNVIVATDDDRIKLAVEEHGGIAMMTKVTHQSGTDRIAELVDKMEVDIVVNIQGDEPLIEPEMINQVVEPLKELKGIPMATLKKRITNPDELNNPNVIKVVTDQDDFAIYFSRSLIPYPKKGFKLVKNEKKIVDVQPPFYKHIGIYAYRKNFLTKFTKLPIGCLEQVEELEQLRALEYGYRIIVKETKFETIAVDIPKDLDKVKKIINKGKSSD